MNRGQRIGVIVSVLWFLGFGFWMWNGSVNQNADWYTTEIGICVGIHDEALEKKCEAEASRVFDQQAENNKKGLPILAGIDLATVAFGWLCAWIIVALGRWVARGKKS